MPCKCNESCSDDFRKRVGCGYTHKGKSSTVYSRDKGFIRPKDADEAELTCPQFFKNTVFYQSIFDDLKDYEEGRLGHSWDLPLPLLTYFKVASSEMESWSSYWEAELMNGK